MRERKFPTNSTLTARLVLGVALILVLSTVIFYILMQPRIMELGLMVVFLGVTAAISIIAGYGAYRLGWLDRAPAIRWSLLGGYLVSSLLTFLNVWLTAQLMFTSAHDLRLATILLGFAAGIAIVLGLFFSSALALRIQRLEQAAREIAAHRLETRTEVKGNDEVAALARTFNQMAEQLQAAEQNQRQLETLRRDLIAWASHDLQTPLASIRAITEALADGVVDDPETVQRYLRTIQGDIRSLSSLIDDLFQMAQLDAGGLKLELEQASLADLISDALESFSEQAGRLGVNLHGSAEEGLDPVTMDTQRICRVLANLIGNALRHTPAGGQVRVQARRKRAEVQVEVEDTGEGIRNEDLPFIFDRFYRGEKSRSRATGGAGLGLAIARGIVEAHGGQIVVESQPGKLTRFSFTLPDRRSKE